MSNTRFRNLSSADFSVTVSQLGAQAKLTKLNTDAPPLPPPPSGPMASPDTATASAGGSDVLISPLTNDTGAGGGLTIAAAAVTEGGGKVAIAQDGTRLTFTPPSSAGTSIINYTVKDANGQTDSADITVTVRAASSAKVAIIANRSSGTAPAGLMFEATAAGFNTKDPIRELRYLWNFDDPKSAPFSAPDERFDAKVNGRSLGWRNSNKAYAHRAGHVFFPKAPEFGGAASKTFTVTCTVRDRDGTEAQGKIDVTIDNPDVVFADTTVGVAPNGDYSELRAQYPNATGYRTFTEAWRAIGDSGRILLPRGQSLDVSQDVKNKKKVQIGDYGNPARSQAQGRHDRLDGAARSGQPWRICGLQPRFPSGLGRGRREIARRESSTRPRSPGTIDGTPGSTRSTIAGSTGFRPVSSYPAGGATQWAREVVVCNVRITDYRQYGIRAANSVKNAWLGVAVLDNPLKKQGLGGKVGENHEHGPYRCTMPQEGSWSIHDCIQFQSWAGWSGSGAYEYNNVPAPQPCVRFNVGEAKGTFWDAADFTFTRFVMEGGNTVLLVPWQESDYPEGPVSVNGIVDKGIIICGATAVSRLHQQPERHPDQQPALRRPAHEHDRAATTSAAWSRLQMDEAKNNRARSVTMVNWVDPVANRHEDGGQGRGFQGMERRTRRSVSTPRCSTARTIRRPWTCRHSSTSATSCFRRATPGSPSLTTTTRTGRGMTR